MKQEFVEFVEKLMEACPDVKMSDNVKTYFNALKGTEAAKVEITDNGKFILAFLQSHPDVPYKSKDIAEMLFVSSRKVSGGMRKLVTDGYVEKIGESPVSYIITEKGKNFKIEE